MKKIIILYGTMGAGKTTFAHRFAADNGYILVRFDSYFVPTNFEKTLIDLKNVCDKINKNIIIDGMVDSLDFNLSNCEIERWFIYSRPNLCLQRFIERAHNVTDEFVYNIFKVINVALKVLEIMDFVKYIDVSIATEYRTKDDLIKELNDIYKSEIEQLIEKINDDHKEIGGFYQGYNLPFGLRIKGWVDKEGQFLTERIGKLIYENIDLKGKSILDLGCYSGYHCIMSALRGATKIHGIDRSERALKYAEKIRQVYNLDNIKYKFANFETEQFEYYDVIFLMSVLHHCDFPFKLLQMIYNNCEYAIFELEKPKNETADIELSEWTNRANDEGCLFRINKNAMDKIARKYNFESIFNTISPKGNRDFLIYRKKK